MYMPGRMRTGSSPSRIWMSSAVYLPACAISVHSLAALGICEWLDRHRRGDHEKRAALHDLLSLAAARRHLFWIGGERELLAALVVLDRERVALVTGDEADHRVVLGGLDHRDAAARTFELRDLVGLDV